MIHSYLYGCSMGRKLIIALIASATLFALAPNPSWALPQGTFARTAKPGTVVKSTSSNTLYFVTSAKSLAGIPSPEVYQCLKLAKQDAYSMKQEELDNFKKTQLLLKNKEGKIYLIKGKQKHHIASPAVFEQEGYDLGDVVTVSQERLDCISEGKPLK